MKITRVLTLPLILGTLLSMQPCHAWRLLPTRQEVTFAVVASIGTFAAIRHYYLGQENRLQRSADERATAIQNQADRNTAKIQKRADERAQELQHEIDSARAEIDRLKKTMTRDTDSTNRDTLEQLNQMQTALILLLQQGHETQNLIQGQHAQTPRRTVEQIIGSSASASTELPHHRDIFEQPSSQIPSLTRARNACNSLKEAPIDAISVITLQQSYHCFDC